MKSFTSGAYTIHICNDAHEWAIEFYNMPEGGIIVPEDLKMLNKECMGFAAPESKEICFKRRL